MKKISIYVGSRANYSSAFSIMKAIQKHPELNLSLVISGAAVLPRFGDIRELIKKDGFKADMETNSLIEGENPTAMSKSIGLGMIDYSNALEKLKPDCVIAIGDRFDVLPWVISAAMMNIPIAHTMGGERSGTIDESIRHAITKFSNIHLAAHYTYGRGFYEQYRSEDNLINYFDYMEDKTQDLVRRRWLSNHFYGITYSYFYKNAKSELNIGGAINEYDGDHFGKIVSSETPNLLFSDPYYFSKSFKRDRNIFLKYKYSISNKTQVFGDLQLRRYFHESNGDDNDGTLISINSKKTFFNPKLGFSSSINEKSNIYFSLAVANREPIRSDFIDSYVDPEHETLYNFELGQNYNYRNGLLKINLFLMEYKNQLITTGEVNDVGAYIRTNVDKSRRYGLEASNNISTKKLNIESNISLSKNYVFDYSEIIYDYGEDFSEYNLVVNKYDKTDIAFSPKLIINNQVEYNVFNNLHFFLKSKFVGQQYLDNTSNINRSIDSFFTNDIGAYINLSNNLFESLFFKFSINNIFNTLYSSNGYTFGYFGGRSYEVRENYYYPQAGRNFMVSLTIKI